jgi:hypothetical protein
MKLEHRLQEIVQRGETARVALERLRQIDTVVSTKTARRPAEIESQGESE